MKENNKGSLFIGLVISFVLGGLLMYYLVSNSDKLGIVTSVMSSQNIKSSTSNSCRACSGTVIVNEGSLSASVEKVYDAVVMIRNYKGEQIQSTGSGFVYKTDSKYGYVLTNHHVIDGASKITLIRSDDE